MAIIIKIGKGNTANGKLDLSDRGKTRAVRGSIIMWQKNPQTNVDSFEIQIKSNPGNIFSTTPQEEGNHWKAIIKDDAPLFAECEYIIPWKDKDGNDHVHDPKIAVKPTTFSPYWFIVFLFSIVIGLLSLEFLLKNTRKNKR